MIDVRRRSGAGGESECETDGHERELHRRHLLPDAECTGGATCTHMHSSAFSAENGSSLVVAYGEEGRARSLKHAI